MSGDIPRRAAEAHRLLQSGDVAAAAHLLEQILIDAPNQPNVLRLAAMVAERRGDIAGARALLERALSHAPGHAALHAEHARLLLELSQAEAALAAYARAEALGLAHPAVWSGKGRALALLDRGADAIACFDACIAANAQDADAHFNRARALQVCDRLDDALGAYDRALALNPHDAQALHNRAVLLHWLGRREDCLAAFDAALAARPQHAPTLYSKGVALLAFGDLKRGWTLHELRLQPGLRPEMRDHARGEPKWDGAPSNGIVRIWPEQGLGDEILFARLAPMAQARAGQIVLECADRLIPLFRRAFPDIAVRAANSSEPAPCQIAAGSLGAALAIGIEHLYSGAPYLRADEDKRAALRARYEALAQGRPIIGIAWASKNQALAKHKSAPLHDWGALLKRDALFVNLQYGETQSDIAAAQSAFSCEIFSDPDIDQLRDMDAFAAQIAAMDHIVSVSNTTVHLAGALGAPCIVLAPPAQGLLWYWGAAGETTPWYASVVIERRAAHQTWAAQIAAAAQRLPL